MPGPQNKVITVQAATAVVYSVQFTRDPLVPGGPISAVIYGTVNKSDGTVELISQSPFPLSGGVDATIRGMMDGAGLTRMRTIAGLEAP